jgi:tetratricopeptide (TPR) repeat protein
MENDEGNSSYVSGEELANLLKRFSSVKLVMLPACESARAEQYGVAGALLRLGIPSIIGMRYPISDKKASLFTSTFYNHLCHGKPLSKAIAYALYAIYEKEQEEKKQSEFKSAEWFTPFLYLNQNVEHLVDYHLPQCKADYFFQRFSPFIPSGVINAKLERTSAKLVARGFVGRRKQLAQLNNILSKRENKAICIHGLGGLGKTSLAVRFIENFYNKGFNIIEWEGEVSEYDIISKISKSLPVEQQEQLQIILLNEKLTTSEKLNFILNDFLKDEKFILFFDNFEDNQIVEPHEDKTQNHRNNEIEISSDLLKEVLLELCQKVSELEGNVFLLFTSRYKIKELPLYYLDLAKMSFPDTYKLINRSPGLINLTLTQKYDLHKRLGGHPRALELFDSFIRNSDENVWEDIEKEFYTVEDFLITQDLLLELLWLKLSDLERSILGTASIMRDLTNQSVLSQITGTPKGQLANILQKLNSFSLVYLEDVWFYVHRLTSQFVLKNFSRESIKEWHRSAYDEFFERKKSLHAIIESRWHLLQAEDYNKAAEVSFILKNNLSSMGHHSYAIQILEELIDLPIERKYVNLLRNELGVLLQHVGDYKKANDLFRSAFSSLNFKDDPKLNPSLILNIGNNYYETGEFTKAIQYFQDLLEWSEQFDDAHYKMIACISLGDVHSELGYVEDSFKYLDHAIVEENSKYHAAKLFHIGKNFHKLGQLQKAFDTFNESLAISKGLNDERGMVGSASNIGVMLREAGQIEEAFKYREYTYELNLKLNRKGEIAKDIIELGILHFMQGNLEKAERMFLDALELTLPIGKKQSTILAYRELGIIEYERRNFTKALEFFNLSMELGKEIGNFPGVALDYYEMGLTFNQMGEIEKAFTHFDNAIDYHSRVKNMAGIGKCIMGKAMVCLNIAKFEDSLESFCNALAILVKMQEHNFARICVNNISKISNLIPKSKFDEITLRFGIIKADNGSIGFLEIDE